MPGTRSQAAAPPQPAQQTANVVLPTPAGATSRSSPVADSTVLTGQPSETHTVQPDADIRPEIQPQARTSSESSGGSSVVSMAGSLVPDRPGRRNVVSPGSLPDREMEGLNLGDDPDHVVPWDTIPPVNVTNETAEPRNTRTAPLPTPPIHLNTQAPLSRPQGVPVATTQRPCYPNTELGRGGSRPGAATDRTRYGEYPPSRFPKPDGPRVPARPTFGRPAARPSEFLSSDNYGQPHNSQEINDSNSNKGHFQSPQNTRFKQ